MSSRRAFFISCLLLTVGTLVAGTVAVPSAAATARDRLMKTSVVALQAAIEKHGAAHMYVYPQLKMVAPGRGLKTAYWPYDPWTGKRLTPGTTRGHYTYTRAEDKRSYVLTGYLSGGRTFVVTGRMAHTPMLAYDHRGQEGLGLIYLLVREWSSRHAGSLPSAAQVSRDGAVGQLKGKLYWPSNPWDHGPMAQRDDRGSFSYVRSDDGDSFTLRLHRALKNDFVLKGTPAKTTRASRQ